MRKTKVSKFYVVYAEPQIAVEDGEKRQMHQVPVSGQYHTDIKGAKKEYDELSVKIGKLLGLVESISLIKGRSLHF